MAAFSATERGRKVDPVSVKRRTITYLEEYVQGVERPQRRLVAAIDRLEAAGLATVLDRALAGANLAPVAAKN